MHGLDLWKVHQLKGLKGPSWRVHQDVRPGSYCLIKASRPFWRRGEYEARSISRFAESCSPWLAKVHLSWPSSPKQLALYLGLPLKCWLSLRVFLLTVFRCIDVKRLFGTNEFSNSVQLVQVWESYFLLHLATLLLTHFKDEAHPQKEHPVLSLGSLYRNGDYNSSQNDKTWQLLSLCVISYDLIFTEWFLYFKYLYFRRKDSHRLSRPEKIKI